MHCNDKKQSGKNAHIYRKVEEFSEQSSKKVSVVMRSYVTLNLNLEIS